MLSFKLFIVLVIFLLILIKVYFLLKKRWCTSKVCLNGKTVIVTGSNTGIGYEAALEFSKRGARVILACRDLKKAEHAREKIVSLTENKNVTVKELNLGSIASIRKFAKDIKETEERLDILVNNAGCGAIKHKFTGDGLQILMQVNYFGPVLLTILLIDLLKKTGSSRIVNVSSLLAREAKLTLQNLNKYPDSHYLNYNNSKLGNVLFTIKLAQLLKGSGVTVYSLHPGVIATDIFRNIKGWMNIILKFSMLLYFKSPIEGAQTTLHTALEQGIEKYSGNHFEECQLISPYKTARDLSLVDEIWNETIKILRCEKEVEELFSDNNNLLTNKQK